MRDRERMKRISQEQMKDEFRCCNCGGRVSTSEFIGTSHRNHCPSCLWSKHVDLEKAGDRKASCHAGMKPIGLTFKQAGIDRYNRPRQGELMINHQCTNRDCSKLSINRIAGDDNSDVILRAFEGSQILSDNLIKKITKAGINLLTEHDEEQIKTELFGKS